DVAGEEESAAGRLDDGPHLRDVPHVGLAAGDVVPTTVRVLRLRMELQEIHHRDRPGCRVVRDAHELLRSRIDAVDDVHRTLLRSGVAEPLAACRAPRYGTLLHAGDHRDLGRAVYDAPERETRGREARPGRAGPESENAGYLNFRGLLGASMLARNPLPTPVRSSAGPKQSRVLTSPVAWCGPPRRQESPSFHACSASRG